MYEKYKDSIVSLLNVQFEKENSTTTGTNSAQFRKSCHAKKLSLCK
jgi:hypothetical protein